MKTIAAKAIDPRETYSIWFVIPKNMHNITKM